MPISVVPVRINQLASCRGVLGIVWLLEQYPSGRCLCRRKIRPRYQRCSEKRPFPPRITLITIGCYLCDFPVKVRRFDCLKRWYLPKSESFLVGNNDSS